MLPALVSSRGFFASVESTSRYLIFCQLHHVKPLVVVLGDGQMRWAELAYWEFPTIRGHDRVTVLNDSRLTAPGLSPPRAPSSGIGAT